MPAQAPDHALSDLVVSVLATITFFEAAIFLSFYLRFFNWSKTRAGKAVAGIIASFIAIAGSSFLFVVFGTEYVGRDVVRIAVWLAGAASFFMLLLALFLAWRKGGPEPILVETRTETEGSPDQPIPPYTAPPQL
jgi:hypothetical protein